MAEEALKNCEISQVREYWNANALCASAIPHPLGTKDYFRFYNILREKNETLEFSYKLHEYKNFAGKKVLDVGCGNGYVLEKYAQEGAEVFGIDITHTAIDLCWKRFSFSNSKGNFQEANAEALPFESNFFDCVSSMGVLHHTPETQKAINEVFRVLKPGGRVILMFYYRDSILRRIKFPLSKIRSGKSIQQQVNEVDGIGNPKGDVYSKEEMRSLLQSFCDLELSVGLLQNWMLPSIGRYIPNVLLRPFARWGGWFLYVKARKPTA